MNNRIGEKNINNFGSEMIITGYRNNKDIDIYFPEYDWTVQNATYDNFKNRRIKCPYERSVFDKGYLGEGKYQAKIKNKITRQYNAWVQMIRRCYDPKLHANHPTYEECTVNEEWLNFQNFAKWYDENYYEISKQKTDLDKDILTKGNKIYGPSTCVFIPHNINVLFIKRNKTRGKYPIGVTYKKQNKKYQAYCNKGTGELKHLGYYDTPEEAFETYKQYKENLIKEIANKYKNQIPDKLYRALLNYEVEITD